MGLTLKRIAAAKRPGRYADGHNLYLQVGPSGTKSWLIRYVIKGRERWMGLGALADFNLEEARARAKAARQLLADGIDPLEARKAREAEEAAAAALVAAKLMTFAQAADSYYKMHARTWSARHAQQFKSALRDYVTPKIGALAVADIDVGQVLRCVEPHWQDKAPTMMRTRARIEAILAWCTVRGYRSGDNPARWQGNLSEALPAPSKVTKVTHFSALPYVELPRFMQELKALSGIPARALTFLILTAARTNEVVGAQWDEIDLDNATWTIPADRSATTRTRLIPPPARGWSPSSLHRWIDKLDSPACAGMVPMMIIMVMESKGFPRLRGDGPRLTEMGVLMRRIPPPARGWSLRYFAASRSSRDSPACAGMVPSQRDRCGPVVGFPRLRGDGPLILSNNVSIVGIPPPARGWSLTDDLIG